MITMHTRSVLSICLLAAAVLAGCQQEKVSTPSPAEMEAAASATSPAMATEAPPFTLLDANSKPVSLKDFRGHWVVLYFYPKDDTPGCICQATEFTALLFEFEKLGGNIVGVSEDPPERHLAFTQNHDLKLALLSDPQHTVMQQYGAWVETSIGTREFSRTIRSTFLIDPKGIIRWHWPEVIPKGHAQRVKDKLVELQKAEQKP